MTRKVIILFITLPISLILAKGSSVQAQETSNYANYPQLVNAIKRAEVYIDSVYSARSLPSISVAVTLDQEIVWQKALGMADLENGISANVNTVYRIQSITKIFTATRLMQLRDDGILHLE
jgi:CubicO group peptidase (beta-lactamase class C family)